MQNAVTKARESHVFSGYRSGETGASLVSMAIFIMALGFLITGFLALENKQSYLDNVKLTAERRAAVNVALDAFIETEGRLPCPAPMTAGFDTAEFGREVANCDTSDFTLAADGVATSRGVDGMRVQTGTVPVRTLNLPDEYIADADDKRFTYAVTGEFAVAGADFAGGFGDISIQDPNGNELGSSAGNAIYAVVTAGEDSRGAYAFSGAQLDACDAGSANAENCDWGNNATFVDTLYKSYDVGNNTFTQSVAFKSSAVTANWITGAWGACSPNCASGTRTRTVTCETPQGDVLPDSSCIGVKPDEEQSCAGVADACEWTTGPWGSCAPICGEPSNHYRAVQCVDADGDSIADSYCTNAKPISEEACQIGQLYEQDGASKYHRACSWYTSPWSSCSEACGQGTQTRSINCVRDDNGNNRGDSGETDIDNSLCGPAPATTQNCNLGSCSWQTGGWGGCSASCGGGSQSRSLRCARTDGATVSTSYCSASRPATTQSCNTQPCYTYAWDAGGWGACSASCGGGSQTRSVVCRRSDGQSVSSSFCSGTKPSGSRACNTQACATYSWQTGGWGNCTQSCGGGNQYRSVQCVSSLGGAVADGNCSGTKPSGSRACNTQACHTYAWVTGGWSGCSASCGGGTQTRSVTCRRSDGQTVSNSNCGGGQPSNSRSCNTQACAPVISVADVEAMCEPHEYFASGGYYFHESRREYEKISDQLYICSWESETEESHGKVRREKRTEIVPNGSGGVKWGSMLQCSCREYGSDCTASYCSSKAP